ADYKSILLNPKPIIEVADEFQRLTPEERQWWVKLYEKHEPKTDNIVELFNQFKEFKEELKKKRLTMYKLEEFKPIEKTKHFSGATNMPTALARMLMIYESCYEEDRE